ILSHAVMNPDVSRDEIGYELEFKLFEKVAEVTGQTPVLIDADELEDDPEGITRAYCEAVGIPFIKDSLSWDP
ncbi:MAG: sulfotransferase family protein, partial [candidate division Zixibacteria bacterium]|nr:sulfotransferase family protein [candidate division Zixibacteria bacterium]